MGETFGFDATGLGDVDCEDVSDLVSNKPIEKATKCDLCVDQLTGPACVNACPHNAMARVDMRDLESVATWLQR